MNLGNVPIESKWEFKKDILILKIIIRWANCNNSIFGD